MIDAYIITWHNYVYIYIHTHILYMYMYIHTICIYIINVQRLSLSLYRSNIEYLIHAYPWHGVYAFSTRFTADLHKAARLSSFFHARDCESAECLELTELDRKLTCLIVSMLYGPFCIYVFLFFMHMSRIFYSIRTVSTVCTSILAYLFLFNSAIP